MEGQEKQKRKLKNERGPGGRDFCKESILAKTLDAQSFRMREKKCNFDFSNIIITQ